MDWSRAKSVLIIAFLLLNVVLGYQLWSNIQEGLSASGDASNLPAETAVVMQKKGIQLATAIPLETPEMRVLTYKVTQKMTDSQRITFKNPVMSKIVFNESELQSELGTVIPELAEYSFVDTSRDKEFVLYRVADSMPVFDVKLELFHSNLKITGYQQSRIKLVPSVNAPKQTVLPATKAIASLIDNHLPAGAVIKEIKLGYHGQFFNNSETQVATPSWRVLLEDGSVYYVNAISGDTEKDSVSSVSSQQG